MKTWNVLPYLCGTLLEKICLLILEMNLKFTDLI